MTDINRVCVTGGAGFIGSNLVRNLLEDGREVLVIDNLSVGKRSNVPSGATLCEGDILDRETASLAAECDAVIHLAARVAIRSSFEFIVEDTSTNVVGTASLLRAISEAPKRRVRKFLFASSMAVYADAEGSQLVSETHPLQPVSPYGVSKLAGEMLVRQVCGKLGIDSGILRLFNTYGMGQALSPYVGVVTIFANAMRTGSPPKIFGNGLQRRDFVHVDDVAKGFIGALDTATRGEAFNIGSGASLTVNEVFHALARVLDFTAAPQHAVEVAGELKNSVADIAKARRDLAYKPAHAFHKTIASVIAGA